MIKEIFFRKVEGGKEKYEITIDSDKMEELARTIAINCGELRIVRTECKFKDIPYEDSFSFNGKDKYYKDVKYKESGNMGSEWDHYDEYEVPLYNCEYKKYTCPPIIDFMFNLMYRDRKAIEMLFDGSYLKLCTFPTVKEKIPKTKSKSTSLTKSYKRGRQKKTSEVNGKYEEVNQSDLDIEQRINCLQELIESSKRDLQEMDSEYEKKKKELEKELEELLRIESINENQKPVSDYIVEMLSLIEYQLVDQISDEEIKRVNDFYNKDVKRDLGEKKKQFTLQ